jgi:hypothetical protein
MISRKLIFWLSFSASAAIAYVLALWESFWPMGRLIAGWYSIFAILTITFAVIFSVSIKWGLMHRRPGIFDWFYF